MSLVGEELLNDEFISKVERIFKMIINPRVKDWERTKHTNH